MFDQRAHLSFGTLLLVVLVSVPVSAEAVKGDETTTNEGTAYSLDDGAAAYREEHLRYQSGGQPARLVLYRCMDGTAFARKMVVERTGAATPDFDFIDGRTGYREGVRSTARGREVYWQKSTASVMKDKTLAIPANAVIDAGFDAMIRAQWTRLSTDAGISAYFLLPSALRFFKVSIERVTTNPAAGAIHLRMKLDTWYGFAAPDTELDYRSSNQRLLRFKGIGTIRDARGRNQAVRIEFPGGLQGRQASASEIAAAQRLPLTGRCGA
ncbi:MAG: hypothetical protein ABIO30_09175 [Thermomonas sp.]